MAATHFSGPLVVGSGMSDPTSGMALGTGTLALGEGGAVTQITSATTGVTLNKPTGTITTVVQNIAAAGEVEFTLTNSFVTALSVPLVCIASGSTGGTTHAYIKSVAAGSCVIGLTNLHATVAETGTLVLNFVVVQGDNA